MESLLPLLQAASDSLHVTSPYFIPGKQGVEIFLDIAERGVSLAILTNSLAATDVAAVHAGYARYRKPLLSGGVRLHELRSQVDQPNFTLRGSGQASLHTKAFTRDGMTGYIGSLNFDPRSASQYGDGRGLHIAAAGRLHGRNIRRGNPPHDEL